MTSLLLSYNWTHTALFYSNETDYYGVSQAVIALFEEKQIEIVHQRSFDYCDFFKDGVEDGKDIFFEWINETKNDARIFVILGTKDCHLSLLKALHDHGLFKDDSQDEYFVIGVNIEVYNISREYKNKNKKKNLIF